MTHKFLMERPEWAVGGKNEALGKDKKGNQKKGFEATKLRQYFGMVKHIDDRVGDILKAIEDNGLTENTIVVFTSDHGEMFYEHGKMNKGNPYEASAKIGFVVKYPEKIKKGKIIHKAHTNVDFTPTMLGLMGVKTNNPFEGVDTSSDFLSEDIVVDGENFIHIAEANNIWVALINKNYKLILHYKYPPTLFDLNKDPHENVNVYNAKGYQETSKKLMKILIQHMEESKEPAYFSKRGLKIN